MPLVTEAPTTTRRHALIIGTATNTPGFGDIADGVREELDVAQDVFQNLLGYNTVRRIVDPGSALASMVAKWRGELNATADDWLVLYYTGHGQYLADGLHLITTEIDVAEAAPTAQNLVGALLGGNPPPHVFLIIDTCESGGATQDLPALAARIRETQGGNASAADFHAVYTTRSVLQAKVGRFMKTLKDVLADGSAAGPDDEFVSLARLIETIDEKLLALGTQRARMDASAEISPRFVPNPKWLPRLRPNMDADTRLRVIHRVQLHTLQSHWGPRARGVSMGSQTGWFFTGRSKVLARISAWLAAQPGIEPKRALIVRGLAGSGKSAVLARVATLTDTTERKTADASGSLANVPAKELPPIGKVDVAVHARAKDASQIALEIAATLDIDLLAASDVQTALISALEQRVEQFTLLLDALDEAVRPGDCVDFLKLLVFRARACRVLVGIREPKNTPGPLSQSLNKEAEVIDLDVASWRDPKDLAAYVERYLRSSAGSSYADADAAETAHQLANAVARQAGTSFLVASVTAHALVAQPRVADPASLLLPADVGAALELDLNRFEGVARTQVRSVLTALACAEGRGAPKEIWDLIAGVLSGSTVNSSDVDRWSKEAAFYIVADQSLGEPVSSLYHAEFTSHLRTAVALAQEGAIAQALVAPLVPTGSSATDWSTASDYVLQFYPRHLARAGLADEVASTVTSDAWISAKRARFGDPATLLSDFDLMIDQARAATPPLVARVVEGCKQYAALVDSAPPIVIDVLFALGQRGRARLMAENIEFPLDRCWALALLAARYAEVGETTPAHECATAAGVAALGVPIPFDTMARYWFARALQSTGGTMPPRIFLFVKWLLAALTVEEGADERDMSPFSLFGFSLDLSTLLGHKSKAASFAERRWAQFENSTFAVPHWLFWAAMYFRELGDSTGLMRVKVALAKNRAGTAFQGGNLVLQAAALVGDVDYLRSVMPGGAVKPGNLALAFVEAGLVEEFDKLEASGALADPSLADSSKRYAWALALRGRFDHALKVADSIDWNLEERARALYRIAGVARRTSPEALEMIAPSARRLREQVRLAVAAPVAKRTARHMGKARKKAGRASLADQETDLWRIESWLAPVFLWTGHSDEALELAESVCAERVVASTETSLAMATLSTARSKGHVHLRSDPTPAEDLLKSVLQVARSKGVGDAIVSLGNGSPTWRVRAVALFQLATLVPDPEKALGIWLDAVVAGRAAGLTTLRGVLDSGDDILAKAGVTKEWTA